MADIPYTRQSMDDTADCTARGGTSAVKDPLIMLATSMQSMAHSVHIIARSTEDNTRANAEIATSLNEVGRFMKENAEASQRTADAISFLAHDYRIVVSTRVVQA